MNTIGSFTCTCNVGFSADGDLCVGKEQTRSSAQGNCSAKSLAASVMSSILPCPPCLPPVMLSMGGGSIWWGGGVWQGEGVGGGGRGHFIHPAIYCTRYHMVLCPKGTSHNSNVFSPAEPGAPELDSLTPPPIFSFFIFLSRRE